MSALRRLAVAFLGAALAFGFCELAVRATGFDYVLLRPMLLTVGGHIPSDDPELLQTLEPGSFHMSREGKRQTINALGFRGPERTAAKPAGTFRIICFGGSNVFGPAVNDDETYPAALERELRRRTGRRVEVWNAGFSSSVLRQDVRLAERALREYDPDLLIFQYSNMGRRAFSEQGDKRDYFRRNPALYAENLVLLPGRNEGYPLLRASAAWRACVIALNRFIVSWLGLQIGSACEPANVDALLSFHDAHKDRVNIYLFLWVPDNPGGFLHRGMKVIQPIPARLPPGAGPEYFDIHPPAHVYAWYAREVADRLVSDGVFGKP